MAFHLEKQSHSAWCLTLKQQKLPRTDETCHFEHFRSHETEDFNQNLLRKVFHVRELRIGFHLHVLMSAFAFSMQCRIQSNNFVYQQVQAPLSKRQKKTQNCWMRKFRKKHVDLKSKNQIHKLTMSLRILRQTVS